MNVRVVECNTQEEWDYVIKKLGRTDSTEYKVVGDCVSLDYPNSSFYRYNLNNEDIIYTFKEWCNEFNHEPEFAKNNELIELPEKWYFKVTPENYKRFKDIRSLSRVYGYITNIPFSNLSWGIIYSDPPIGYTEISFEAFEKHVLSKESKSIKTEEPVKEEWMSKFKVGDRVRIPLSKKGNIWYKNNVSELDNYNENYFIISGIGSNTNIGLSRADGKNFIENSFCESDLVLYTEPTKEEWVPKVGDWVVVKSYSQAKQGNGITKDNLVSKLYIPGFDNASGMLLKEAAFSVKQDKRFYNILKSHIIRKAEPWEIPIEEQTTTIYSIQKTGRIDRCESVIDVRFPDTTIKFKDGDYYYGIDPVNMNKPATPKESFKLNKLPTKSWY